MKNFKFLFFAFCLMTLFSCGSECLTCVVPITTPSGDIDRQLFEFCEDEELLFNGTTYASLNELELALIASGATGCQR